MAQVTIETGIVEMKVNGQVLTIDPSKLHPTWLAEMLAYGCKQKVNDTYSGEKGQTKFDLCHAMINELERGEPMEARARRATTTLTDVERVATDMARTDLLALFKAMTKKAKIADMCAANEKVAAFFTIDADGKATWNIPAVLAWIEKQRETGKRSYLSDAHNLIEAAADADF